MRNEFLPLFLVLLTRLMTLIWNADAVSHSLLPNRLVIPSMPVDPLVEGQETRVQHQLSLEDLQSRLKWLPLSKPKNEHSPAPTKRKQLPRNQHYPRHLPKLTILQSPHSFAQIVDHYVNPSYYGILVPLQFTILFTPSPLPSSFNGSLAIVLSQVTN